MKKLLWIGLALLMLLPLAVGCAKRNPAAPDNIYHPGLPQTPTPQPVTTLILIDDCEHDGSYQNQLGGYWFTYKDSSSTVIPPAVYGGFTMESNTGQGAPDPRTPTTGTNSYVHMTGVIGTGGFVGVGTSLLQYPDPPQDFDIPLTQYKGVLFYVKGDNGRQYRLNLKSGNITDSNYYGVEFTTTSAWTKIQCDFSHDVFKQQDWGPTPTPGPTPTTLEYSLAHAKALQWQAQGTAAVDFYLDEIFFYK